FFLVLGAFVRALLQGNDEGLFRFAVVEFDEVLVSLVPLFGGDDLVPLVGPHLQTHGQFLVERAPFLAAHQHALRAVGVLAGLERGFMLHLLELGLDARDLVALYQAGFGVFFIPTAATDFAFAPARRQLRKPLGQRANLLAIDP